MRELKFRAWDRVKRKMLYGVSPFNAHITDENEPLLSLEYSEHDDCEFMQYTGLKDKNGKEIYEGDIVKFNETICVVEFDEMYARYTLRDQSDDVVIGFDALIIIPFGVIGNIHENPELLEEEE